MKRTVYLGMGDGGLWLSCAGEQLPAGATVIDARDARFWLRQSVPPMAHPNILHAISEIADALGYPFHGATPFADMPFVMDTLETALVEKHLVAFRLVNVEGGGKGPEPAALAVKDDPKPKPAEVVNAVIDEPDIHDAQLGTVVLVAKKAKDPDDGKTHQYTHPTRKALKLRTDVAFTGKGTFECSPADKVKFFTAKKGGDEIKLDGKANVFKGGALSSGVTIYVQGVAPAKDIKAKLTLSGGSKTIGTDDKATITSVEVTLDIHKPKPAGGAFSQDDKVFVGRNLLVQNANNSFDRAQLVIQKIKPDGLPAPLTVVLKPSADGHMDAYKVEDAKKPAGQTSELKGGRFEIKTDKLPHTLWAQAKSPSEKMKDSGFTLGVVGADEDEGDKVTATAVQIKLDICKTRTKAAKKGEDPVPMSDADKINVGRFVHEQDASFHHGRAMLIVRQVLPKTFKGTVILKAINAAKTDLFPKDNEHHKAGEASVTLPHDIDLGKEKNEDHKFWVEGKTGNASTNLLDAGYWIELKDDRPGNGDTVLMTVVKFTNLKADIPATPAQTTRTIGGVANANQAARHSHEIAGTAADHWDFDDAKNQAIVLIEGSVRAGTPINLTVKITPAAAAKHISWDAPRDIRPAPDGDHKDIAALSGNPTPTRNAADHSKATMTATGVGTFHVAPFIDCNGTGHFEPTIDREPYLTMNLILVRVEGVRNESVAGTAALCSDFATGNAAAMANTVIAPGSPNPSGSTGAYVVTGDATIANAAAYCKATVKLTGGGDKGRRGIEKTAGGLDRVFAGWGQHIAASGSSVSTPKNLDIIGLYIKMIPNPIVTVPPGPKLPEPHYQFFVFTQSTGVFKPPNAAPVPEACPVLDVSPNAPDGTGGDSCTGQWGNHGPKTPLKKTGANPTIVDKALGQEWTVDTLDSPRVGLKSGHPGFPGCFMVGFRFNISFRVDLLFWTNLSGVPTPSAHPANRLYASVQTNTWTVAYSVGFDWNAAGHPIVGAAPAVTIVMNKDGSATRRAIPVDGSGLETRFPAALTTLKLDSTT